MKDKELEFKRKVFLGGLNKKTDELSIEKFFSKFGEIEDILINRNIKDGSSKGCAFLLFNEIEVAQKLINDETVHFLDGNYIEVKQCFEKSKSKNTTILPKGQIDQNFQGDFFSQLQNFLVNQGMFQMMFNPGQMPVLPQMPLSGPYGPNPVIGNSGHFYSDREQINSDWSSFPVGHLEGYENMAQVPVDRFFEKCPIAKLIMKEPKGFRKELEPMEKTEYEKRESLMELLRNLKGMDLLHNFGNLRFNRCMKDLFSKQNGPC